jgi:predicted phosphodiesterase
MMTPERIVVAGDWHGNTAWGTSAIKQACEKLGDEPEKLVLHAGDLGVWPGGVGKFYLDMLESALRREKASLLVAPGNHDWYPYINGRDRDEDGLYSLRGSISAFPRGYRWEWHGRTWMAMGGAVSVDKATRTEGKDWWPEEEITNAEAEAAIAAGHADVIITHDCPSEVHHSFGHHPSWWAEEDLAHAANHRLKLQAIVNKVQPSVLIHGHLHIPYSRTVDFGYGPVKITGLGMDGDQNNWAILNTRTLKWE